MPMNAKYLARRIVQNIAADSKTTVNDKCTTDSAVEHDIDAEVIVEGYIYSVNVCVTRFGKVE